MSIITSFKDLATETAKLLAENDDHHPNWEPWWISSPAVRFLQALRPKGPWQLSAFAPDGEDKGRGILAQSAADVDRFIAANNGTRNIYYTMNPTRSAVKVKPSKRDIGAIEFVPADLDPRDGETPEDAKRRYMKAIEQSDRAPIAIVDSGNGLQALFRIERIELPTFNEKIIGDVEARVKTLLLSLGGTTGTQNIDRILRLPGTTNLPTAKKARVGRAECEAKLLALNEDGPVYTLADFPLDVPPKGNNGHAANAFLEVAEESKQTIKTGDASRSGAAFRFCRDRIRFLGNDASYETVLALMLQDDGEAGEWANEKNDAGNKRELRRTYDNAAKSVFEEDSTAKLDVSGKVQRFDPFEEHDVPSFPADVLPPMLEDYVARTARSVGVDTAGVGMGVLTTISAALDHRTRLSMTAFDDFLVRPRLWTLLVGDSSEKKTTVMNKTTWPLEEHEASLQPQYKAEKALWSKLSREEQKSTDEPELPPRFVAYDTTYEKLCEIVAVNPKGVLMKRDEIAGLILEFEKTYAAPARAGYLKANDGGFYRQERKSRDDTSEIENFSISFLGAIQPRRLAEIKIETLTSDGFLQRFFPIVMKGSHFTRGEHVDRDAYGALIKSLIRRGAVGRTINLTPAAQEIMDDLRSRIFNIGKYSTGIASGFSEFVPKVDGYAGSLALCLQAAHSPDRQMISIDAPIVQRVARLIDDFILPHALHFYQFSARNSLVGSPMRKAASFILTDSRPRFTASDLAANVSDFRNKSLFEVNRMIAPLIASGWINPTKPGPDNNAWTVFDWVRPHFADRAVEEERRKAELARLMNGPRHPKTVPPKGG